MKERINELNEKFLIQNVEDNFQMIRKFVKSTNENDVIQYWKKDKDLFEQYKKSLILHLRSKGLKRYIIEYLYVLTFRYTRGVAKIIHPANKKINPEDMQKAFSYQYNQYLKEFEDDLKDLYMHIDDYEKIFYEFEDIKSKLVLVCIFMYRLTTDGNYFSKCADGRYWQYFDMDIIKCDKNEVFVNCGGWIGDTVQNYISIYGNKGKIYCYEPGKDNLEKLHYNLDRFENVVIRPYGIGASNSKMGYTPDEGYNGTLNEFGEETIEVKSMDQDINDKITFINMDIEGFEIPALKGAERHIKNEKPKLAICVYHLSDDIWKIGQLIKEYNSGYQLFLRHYRQGVKFETVMYAVQKES